MTNELPELRKGRYMWYINPASHEEGKGYRPSIVIEGECGHFPNGGGETEPWYWGDDLEQAEAIARQRNARMGLTEADETRILMSSMRACPTITVKPPVLQ